MLIHSYVGRGSEAKVNMKIDSGVFCVNSQTERSPLLFAFVSFGVSVRSLTKMTFLASLS